MNSGLLQKALREIWLMTLICGLGLAAFEGLIAWVFWSYQAELTNDVLQIEFVRNFINSMISGQTGGDVQLESLNSLAWVHPLVLSLLFAQLIAHCTRLPAAEIDRGTIDVLFAWPVTRRRIFLCESAAWTASGAAIIALAGLGSAIGHLFVPPEGRPEALRLLIVLLNLLLLYLAFGGVTYLISARCDRRGRAIGAAFGIVLVFFLWNFIAPYWAFAQDIAFLNILHYYKPMPILSDGEIPWRNMAVLAALAAIAWTAAGALLERRDICTV